MNYCWRSRIKLRCGGIRHQPREWRDAGFGMCSLQEPLAEAQYVQSHYYQDVPQMDPCKAHVASPS